MGFGPKKRRGRFVAGTKGVRRTSPLAKKLDGQSESVPEVSVTGIRTVAPLPTQPQAKVPVRTAVGRKNRPASETVVYSEETDTIYTQTEIDEMTQKSQVFASKPLSSDPEQTMTVLRADTQMITSKMDDHQEDEIFASNGELEDEIFASKDLEESQIINQRFEIDEESEDEKRAYPRATACNKVLIYKQGSSSPSRGFLVDLSPEGFLVSVEGLKLEHNDRIAIEVIGNSHLPPNTFQCAVSYKNNNSSFKGANISQYGLQIIAASYQALTSLQQYS